MHQHNSQSKTDDFLKQLILAARPNPVSASFEFRSKLKIDLHKLYAQKLVERKQREKELARTNRRSAKNSIWSYLKHFLALKTPRLAFAPFILLLLTGTITAYAYTSPQITRKSSLYVLKRTIENIELSLANSPEKKINTYLRLSERRFAEAKYLADTGKIDSQTMFDLNSNLNQSLVILQQVNDFTEKDKLIASITNTADDHLIGLKQIASKIANSEENQPILTAQSEEVTSLALVINNVATNTDKNLIDKKLDTSSQIEELTLNNIAISTIPPELKNFADSVNIYVNAFDKAGRDITQDKDLTFTWRIIAGNGDLRVIQPNQAIYTNILGANLTNKDVVIEVKAFQKETVVSSFVNIPFTNPLNDIDIASNFGDIFDLNLNLNPQLKAILSIQNNHEDISTKVSYLWEVIEGKAAIINSKSSFVDLDLKEAGKVEIKLTVTYLHKTISKQFSFQVIKNTHSFPETTSVFEQTPTFTPTLIAVPFKTKTTLPSKDLFLKIYLSPQAITTGQTANVKFIAVDEHWNLYPYENIKATLSGSGTLSAITNNRDGTYTGVYIAPKDIPADMEVTITGTIASVAEKPEAKASITVYTKRINILVRSVSAKEDEFIDVPINISASEALEIQSYSFCINLPFPKVKFVAGGTMIDNCVFFEGNELGTHIIRLKIKENLSSQKLNITISNATAFDVNGEQIKVKKGNGYINVNSNIPPSPTSTPKATKTPIIDKTPQV